MNTKDALIGVLVACAVAGCATSGTRTSTESAAYKDLAKSQQAWCSTFKSNCTCSIDGMQTTCSLVYACMNSGNCKAAP
jgi:hypothetical protein